MSEYITFLENKVRKLDSHGEELLSKRSLSKACADAVGVSNDGDLILFPYGDNRQVPDRFKVINATNKTIWWSERSPIDDNNTKKTLFNKTDFVDNEYLIITEGEFDCLAWVDLGFTNVVSISDGASSAERCIKDNYLWVNSFKEIFLSFDQDVAGIKAAEKVKMLLPRNKWRVVKTNQKDMNDCLSIDHITPEEAQGLLSSADRYMPAGIMDAKAISLDVVLSSVPKGLRVHYYGLDSILGGLRPGEVTVVSGDTGVGKTSFCVQLIHNIVSDGHACWMCSQEMNSSQLLQKIAGVAIGRSIRDNPESVTEEEKTQLKEWFGHKPLFVDPDGSKLSIKRLVESLEFFALCNNGKVAMIEDLGYLADTAGRSSSRENYEFIMKVLHAKAIELNLHILLVVHPTQVTDDRGNIGMNHLKGSSGIKQYAQNVLLIKRMDREDASKEGMVKVKVAKNRALGNEGTVYLFFDKVRGQYRESL